MLNSITQRAKFISITAVSRNEIHVFDYLFLPENVCKILWVCLCVLVCECEYMYMCVSRLAFCRGEPCIDFQPKVQSHKSSLA